MIFPAFLALVKPVSTMANPACIQKTKAAPIKNQTPNTCPFKTSIISSVIDKFSSVPVSACKQASTHFSPHFDSACPWKKAYSCFIEFVLCKPKCHTKKKNAFDKKSADTMCLFHKPHCSAFFHSPDYVLSCISTIKNALSFLKAPLLLRT